MVNKFQYHVLPPKNLFGALPSKQNCSKKIARKSIASYYVRMQEFFVKTSAFFASKNKLF